MAVYQPKVYRSQGGAEIVIASSGKITQEAGGHIAVHVETGTTTAALSAMGVSLVTRGTTGTGVNTYTMNAPIIGVQKFVTALLAATSETIAITGVTTTVTFGSTLMPKMVFSSPGTAHLIGRTTAIWDVINVGSTVTPAPLLALSS
jgi:hypothetical protein